MKNFVKSFTFISAIFSISLIARASDFNVGKVPDSIKRIRADGDFGKNLKYLAGTEKDLRGQDHILLDAAQGRLIVFGMDQKIYKVDLATHTTQFLAYSPGVAGGAKIDPLNPQKIIFCSSQEDGVLYPPTIQTGIYELDLSAQPAVVTPKILRVLKDTILNSKTEGVIYSKNQAPKISISKLATDLAATRPFGICDDLTISSDGQRVYIAEPYGTQGGGFGDEFTGKTNQEEILKAKQNGKIWLWNRTQNSLSLIGTHLAFVDGIALVPNAAAAADVDTLLFTELSRYRLLRSEIGDNQTDTKVVLQNLPGMPNALEVDQQGRVFMAFNKIRSFSLDLITNFPIFKKFVQSVVLKLPQALKPVPRETGFLILSPNSEKGYDPLYYTVHDGSLLTSITNVVPDFQRRRLYLAVYDRRYPGLYMVPMPDVLLSAIFPTDIIF